MTNVLIKKLRPGALIPAYQTPGSAGFDLHACIETDLELMPGEHLRIPTGIAIWLNDPNWALCLWERSSLGSKGIALRGGLIDSDYQGELMVTLQNNSAEPLGITPGMRIAQAVCTRVLQLGFVEVDDFPSNTVRGSNGHGSTGQ